MNKEINLGEMIDDLDQGSFNLEKMREFLKEYQMPPEIFVDFFKKQSCLGALLNSDILSTLKKENLLQEENIRQLMNVRRVQEGILDYLTTNKYRLQDDLDSEQIEEDFQNLANEQDISVFELFEICLNAFNNDLYAFDKYSDHVWTIACDGDYNPSGTRSFVSRLRSQNLDEVLFKYRDLINAIYTCASSKEEFDQLTQIVQKSEKAAENLKQIVENNLQDQYSFEQLLNLISKDNKKQRVKLNF